jgi:uncharacterized membrane protein
MPRHEGGARRAQSSGRFPRREGDVLGLTPLGTFHTAISLIALIAGFGALWRYKEISTGTLSGQTFLGGTVLSCVTGLGIFQHGGFGNPHILAIVTLVVLAVALAAEYLNVFGRVSRHVATVSYSLSFFFHFIPGTVETLTRLPAGAPYLSGPDDPKAQPIIGFFYSSWWAPPCRCCARNAFNPRKETHRAAKSRPPEAE